MASAAAEPFPSGGERPATLFVLGPEAASRAHCAQVLGLLGARPPPAGDIATLCEQVCDLFGRGSASPVAAYPLPPAWWADRRLDALVPAACEMLGTGLPLLADPRLPRLLPFWLRAAREAGYAPRIVVVLCSPAALSGSEFEVLDGLADILRYSGSCKRCRVIDAEWSDDPAVPLRRLLALLAPAGPPPMADLLAGVLALAGNRPPPDAARSGPFVRHPLVRHVLGVALGSADIEEAADRLAPFVEQFVAFRQLLGSFESAQAASARALVAAEALARDGQERSRGLAKAQNAMARLARASEAAERLRSQSEAAVEASRAAEADAQARVLRLEADLAVHASALSDALARLRDAEARAVAPLRREPLIPAPRAPGWRRVLRLG